MQMGLANFQSVFIGIETPNEDSLRETKKHPSIFDVMPKFLAARVSAALIGVLHAIPIAFALGTSFRSWGRSGLAPACSYCRF